MFDLKLNTEAKRCFATHDEDIDYFKHSSTLLPSSKLKMTSPIGVRFYHASIDLVSCYTFDKKFSIKIHIISFYLFFRLVFVAQLARRMPKNRIYSIACVYIQQFNFVQ